MKFSKLQDIKSSQDYIDTFAGYNHSSTISQYEFYDMRNMSSDNYPYISPRNRRGTISAVSSKTLSGYISTDNGDFYVRTDNGDPKLYKVGSDESPLIYLDSGEKTFVTFGSYLIILPDKAYINTQNLNDIGYLDKTMSATNVSITLTLCNENGAALGDVKISEPASPVNGDLWLDASEVTTTNDNLPMLKQYFSQSAAWSEIDGYIKIEYSGIGSGFSAEDVVTITGFTDSASEYDMAKIIKSDVEIVKVGTNYILIKGTLKPGSTGGSIMLTRTTDVGVSRKSPAMDFVVESNNRLWGCRYGSDNDGNQVNEIYASKLGDFKNWSSFKGISTDSYAASCGSLGAWTGAINYNGYPYFFKEDSISKVYGNVPSSYQISVTECKGVQKYAGKSLAIVNNVLYYKSTDGVCAFTGSTPTDIGAKLGNAFSGIDVVTSSGVSSYYGATAGATKNKYYLSAKSSEDNTWHLLVYDTKRGLWEIEDEMHVRTFIKYKPAASSTVAASDLLGAIRTESSSSSAMASGVTILGLTESEESTYGTEALTYTWMIQTGKITHTAVKDGTGYSPFKKYITRMSIRMELEFGTRVDLYVKYNSAGDWEHVSTINGTRLKSCSVGIRPKRCDHFELKLEGVGKAKIHSVAKTMEIGSDT